MPPTRGKRSAPAIAATPQKVSKTKDNTAPCRFSGRHPLGKCQPPVPMKNGFNFARADGDVRLLGGACSEVLGGANLAKLLEDGFDMEVRAMTAMKKDQPAEVLSLHTSAGVPVQLDGFFEALAPHVAFGGGDDWCCNLQAEGGSAVHAAVDMCLQAFGPADLSAEGARTRLACGASSYHGPASTSPGGATPLGAIAKGLTHTARYPVPSPFFRKAGETEAKFHSRMLGEFKAYLGTYGSELGVLLIEPQWGSSVAAMPWPPALLRSYVSEAKKAGLAVIVDEIMCGLGRHGAEPAPGGTGCFLSECWDLKPDCVTFGKAIAGGAGHVMSGAILLHGASKLGSTQQGTAFQSHTYAGSSARALANGTALLKSLPTWRKSVLAVGAALTPVLAELNKASKGAVIAHGQGCMWGGIFAHTDAAQRATANAHFKKLCGEKKVLPYFVPVGGFMLTPRYDDNPTEFASAVKDMADCALATVKHMGWAAKDLVPAFAAGPAAPGPAKPAHVGTPTPKTTAPERFSGRHPLGKCQPPVPTKNGFNFARADGDVRLLGGACSEVLGGANLAKLLEDGFDMEVRAMTAMKKDQPAEVLSLHTSAGVPVQLDGFFEALAPHVAFGGGDDWCCNLQAEGGSAVHAAVDMCLQAFGPADLSAEGARTRLACGASSYHGPASTSPGGATPLGAIAKGLTHTARYPVPSPFFRKAGETEAKFHSRMLGEFKAYLGTYGSELGVLLIEPQWGSSVAAMPWPPALLRSYVSEAKKAGLAVIVDEIMCGLGRHGAEPAPGGTGCFLSECWDLKPDCVTFGKAIAGGAGHVMSGAILLHGASKLGSTQQGTAFQSHTYAGSSARALANGTALLKSLPTWRKSVLAVGAALTPVLAELNKASKGAVIAHGQGCMWGGIFAHTDAAQRATANAHFKKLCGEKKVLPYFVPVGGFMLTPRYDDNPTEFASAVKDMADCALATVKHMGWAAKDLVPAFK